MIKQMLVNPMPDGTIRTIKAQSQQVSYANLVRQDGLGATAVMEIVTDAKDVYRFESGGDLHGRSEMLKSKI